LSISPMFSMHSILVAVVNFCTSVLRRYRKQINMDTEEAYHRTGPADNMWSGIIMSF